MRARSSRDDCVDMVIGGRPSATPRGPVPEIYHGAAHISARGVPDPTNLQKKTKKSKKTHSKANDECEQTDRQTCSPSDVP